KYIFIRFIFSNFDIIKKSYIMKIASLTQGIVYHETRPSIKVLLENELGKEIRIAFKKNQIMKEHTAPFPIVVEIFKGKIDFGVSGEIQSLKEGDLIALDAMIPHDLKAIEDSIIRLSLYKSDSIKRVEEIVK